MSTKYVRTLFRQWCNEVAVSESIPFYDTINIEQDPDEDVWFTVEFFAEDREGMYCDKAYQEYGSITVVVIAQPGTGDDGAITALEAIVPALWVKKDPNNMFWLEKWLPSFEDSAGSADREYRIGAIFQYRHSNS